MNEFSGSLYNIKSLDMERTTVDIVDEKEKRIGSETPV